MTNAIIDALHTKGTRNVKPGYYETLIRGESTPDKNKIRSIVLDTVLRTCSWSEEKPLNMITLPGTHWKLEHELSRITENQVRFTAFESKRYVMSTGVGHAPGNKPGRDWEMYHTLNTEYFETDMSTWLHCDFLDWCLVREDTFPNQLEIFDASSIQTPWELWLDRFWNVGAYWLDFTSNIHDKMERALAALPYLSASNDDGCDKPIVVSVMKGRERTYVMNRLHDLGMSREEYIVFLLDRRPGYKLEVQEVYEYSVNGAHMLNVVGIWRNNNRRHES